MKENEHIEVASLASFHYGSPDLSHTHGYLLPVLLRVLEGICPREKRIFEIGAGNGSLANELSHHGYSVMGVEPSEKGVRIARNAYPYLQIHQGSGYDDLSSQYGQYPLVLSLEVIEHVYMPRKFARTCFDLLEPGGHLILSTPYHGYCKNLALAITGKMDQHFTALWDHGHIKFWSMKTLGTLLRETSFSNVRFVRVGRIPVLAKSMIAVADKPLT